MRRFVLFALTVGALAACDSASIVAPTSSANTGTPKPTDRATQVFVPAPPPYPLVRQLVCREIWGVRVCEWVLVPAVW